MSALCAGWVLVQLLAKKMKTKNHFDLLNSACGACSCGGGAGACANEESQLKTD